MKKSALAAALITLICTVAQSQDNPGENKRGTFRFSFSGGSGYGYGGGWSPYGGGLRCGYSSGYGYGYGYGYGPSIYSYGGPPPYMPGGYGYGGYGYGYGGGGYYYGGLHGGLSRPHAAVDIAGPVPPPSPVADRRPDFASARAIEEGRRRFKMGDYRGAADEFRAAVIAQTENSLAQAWFALALGVTGDGKNADKALRTAAAAGFPADKVSLADLFRDDRERTRVMGVLSKVAGDGSLTAAYALSLAGDAGRLKQLAEKDPVARGLLPKP